MRRWLIVWFACSMLASANGQHPSYQNIVNEFINESNAKGASVSILYDEGKEWRGVAGFSHDMVPMDTSMYLGIASNTKLFTAILSLKLIEAGFFDLEDTIGQWLSPIQYVDPSITVRQLLQHNGGVNDFINNTDLFPGLILSDGDRIWTPEETLSYLFEPLTFPGGGVFYSNANYILAAMVIEKATGASYNKLLRDSILIPLDLTDIYLEGYEEIPGVMAHPFLLGFDYSDTSRIALGTSTWSAGFLVSRPPEIARWYDLVFNKEIVSDFVKNNISDFIDWPDDRDGKDMGMGLYRLNVNDRIYYGHGGGTIGYSSYTLYDVECGNVVSVMLNELFADPLSLAISLMEEACMVTSTKSTENAIQHVNIIPNPASDLIYVPQASYLILFSLDGRPVRTTSQNQLSLEAIPPGVYFLQVVIKDEVFLEKVVIALSR